MRDILGKQSELNRSTRGQWRLYASHRQELERLIVPDRPGGRICVLGAGNCNDIDLAWLTQVYREVHLVDIDGQALAQGTAFQKVEKSPTLRLHAQIDLNSAGNRMSKWQSIGVGSAVRTVSDGLRPVRTADPTNCTGRKIATTASDVELADCTRAISDAPQPLLPELAGAFDMVVSPCVLSQLLTPLRDAVKESNPGFAPLLSAIRRRHLRLMHSLLGPAGRGILACDLFSSAIFPQLPGVPREDLPDLMRKMLAAGKFFSGLDPVSIERALRKDPLINPDLAGVEIAAPWLWHLGLAKSYLVYALKFRKSSGACSKSLLEQRIRHTLNSP